MSTASISLPAPRIGGFGRSLRIFVTETRYEFVRLLRTRAFSLSVTGFPVVFYIFFGLMMNRGAVIGGVSVAKYMLGCYAVFGMVGAALFGIGVGLASEIGAGWLELKQASPMPEVAYLLAKCVTAIAFGLLIVNLLTLLGVGFGNVHLSLIEYARMIGLTIAGSVPFACMGLLLALLVPFNAAPGIANMIYLPMSFCSGLWVPIQFLPKFLQHIAPLLPTYHLAQLMVAGFGYPSAGSAASHWFGLLGFTLIMLGGAWIAFRRHEENS